jgi:hypothetical protein
LQVEVEDALGEIDGNEPVGQLQNQMFSNKVIFNGNLMGKARALAKYSKTRKFVSSTDRLKRVQEVGRYSQTMDESSTVTGTDSDGEVLLITDPIATILHCENQFWLCIGEVNGLKIDGRTVGYISLNILSEDTVTVSYQILGLRRTTSDDDPKLKHDWRTCSMEEKTFVVPGWLLQPIDPVLSETHQTIHFYMLESTVLVALTASIFQNLTNSDLKKVPKFATTNEYPYRSLSGK